MLVFVWKTCIIHEWILRSVFNQRRHHKNILNGKTHVVVLRYSDLGKSSKESADLYKMWAGRSTAPWQSLSWGRPGRKGGGRAGQVPNWMSALKVIPKRENLVGALYNSFPGAQWAKLTGQVNKGILECKILSIQSCFNCRFSNIESSKLIFLS